MYKIIYTKRAVGDIKKIKQSGMSEKTKRLIDILKINPFQIPLPYEKLLGDLERSIFA